MQDPAFDISTNEDIECANDTKLTVDVTAKPKHVKFVEKRRKWIRSNLITRLYKEGSQNISQIFSENEITSSFEWNLKWHTATKKGLGRKRQINLSSTQSSINSKSLDIPIPQRPVKETIRSLSLMSSDDINSDNSILSSYPIHEKIEKYLNNHYLESGDDTMNYLSKNCISSFVETCEKQIKSVLLMTNNYLRQYIDLNSSVLIVGQQTFVKVHTIPRWTQIRILEDNTNQRYIALKNSQTPSLFVLSSNSPLLNQRWICYPLISMNTFENEMTLAKDSSINTLILRMLMLKCFQRIYNKNEPGTVKFDIGNILLVSSNCGFIVVFGNSDQELDIASLNIFRIESVSDIPDQYVRVKKDLNKSLTNFFHQQNIIPLLISALWPIDNLAYTLARLAMKSYD